MAATRVELGLDLYGLGQAASVDWWQMALGIVLPSEGLSPQAQDGVYELYNQLAASVRHRGEQRAELREQLEALMQDATLDGWSEEFCNQTTKHLLPALTDLAEALEVGLSVIQSESFERLPPELRDDLAFAYEETLSLYQTLVALSQRFTPNA